MKVTVTFTEVYATDLTSLASFFETHSRFMAEIEAEDVADGAAEHGHAEVYRKCDAPKAGDADLDPVEKIVAETDAAYTRAKTVSIKAGNKGEEGAEVVTDDGRDGVIEACYRGRAVVSFEDGSAEVLGGTTLALRPQEDEEPEVGTADLSPGDTSSAEAAMDILAKDGPDAPRRRRREAAEEPVTPRDQAQALIDKIKTQDGGAESVLTLLQEFDSSATGLDALTDEEAEEIIPELEQMLA